MGSVGTSPRADLGEAAEPAAGLDRGQPPEPLEIEVKLGVSRPVRIARLLRSFERHGLAGFAPIDAPRVVTLSDRYVDTAVVGGWLQALGMRARLRHVGGSVILAVKRGGEDRAGVTVRVEMEAAATSSLDPSHWPASPARAALQEAVGTEPLLEIAVLHQRRLVRTVANDATRVELSLDRVDALDRGRVLARRYELEAELLQGDEHRLSALADALSAVDGITPAVGSKLAFGLAARKAMARTER